MSEISQQQQALCNAAIARLRDQLPQLRPQRDIAHRDARELETVQARAEASNALFYDNLTECQQLLTYLEEHGGHSIKQWLADNHLHSISLGRYVEEQSS